MSKTQMKIYIQIVKNIQINSVIFKMFHKKKIMLKKINSSFLMNIQDVKILLNLMKKLLKIKN
jgi:hypothetical protein